MPMITVQLTREGSTPGADRLTPEEKAAIHMGMSKVLLDVLGKPLEWTWVVIEEVDPENWGWGGLPALDYRARMARDGQERGG